MSLWQRFRSLSFDILFYPGMLLYHIVFWPFALIFPGSYAYKVYKTWALITLWGLKNIVGLSYRVEGREYLDQIRKNPWCLIACKHQSMWETLVFAAFIDGIYVVLKRELMKIPVLSTYFRKTGAIPVDRGNGSSALKSLLKEVHARKQRPGPILLFPEGTRSQPGQQGRYHPGAYAIYHHESLPVFPVALNSGCFWGRRSFFKRPGEIVVQFLPPILPGLSREEFMNQLTHSIETASNKLLPTEN